MSNIYQISSKRLQLSEQLQFFLQFSKTHTIISRKFDHMGSSVGFTDFILLYMLYAMPGQKLRPSELADLIGLTPSGVTRLIPPLEKIGMVSRSADPRDARIRYISLAPGGERVLEEAIERAEYVATAIMPTESPKQTARLTQKLEEIRRNCL